MDYGDFRKYFETEPMLEMKMCGRLIDKDEDGWMLAAPGFSPYNPEEPTAVQGEL